MRRIISFLSLFTLLIILIGCNKTQETTNTSNSSSEATTTITTQKEEIKMISVLTDVYPDKSRYLPNENAKITIDLYNKYEDQVNGNVRVSLVHLFDIATSKDSEVVSFVKGDRKQVTVEITTPNNDFTGYIVVAEFIVNGNVVDTYTSALDVSSEWDKFPRYGYLVNFAADSISIDMVLKNFNKHHITGIQYYDWQYKHHMPVGFDEQGNVLESWLDIANRRVLASTVNNYINKAHEYNIKSMNYNLLFGAYEDYLEDGVSAEWGLYKDTEGNIQDNHPLPSDWQTSKIMLMNPSNPNWQEYIINSMEKSFEAFNFDGWHVDQLGNRGNLYDYNGNRIDLPSGYVDLLVKAKNELGIDLVFNAVDGYAQPRIAKDIPVDFLYHEVWTDTTYRDLKSIIDTNFRLTNNEKSTVLAAYMNYKSSHSKGLFNTHSVLLTNATIFASGGSHIELGDTGMLANEYFPNANLQMSLDLKERLRRYYDFMVAYQNLLRDNVTENMTRKINIEGVKTSTLGVNDSVWYFVKNKGNMEVLHLINILGNQNDWRDDYKQKKKPEILENSVVKYYIDEPIKSVGIASPDFNQGKLQSLTYKTLEDDKGVYIEIIIPKLEYWNMIVINK